MEPFIELLTKTAAELMCGNNKEVFIIGDFNINYAAKGNKERTLLKDFEALTSLRQVIDQITRFSRTNSTIDLLFTNSEHISNFGTLDLNLSDHEAIFMTRKKKKEHFNIKSTTGRSYLNYNKELFQTQIINSNWDAFQDTLDVNVYWENLERIERTRRESNFF